jgi:hypothetical protein
MEIDVSLLTLVTPFHPLMSTHGHGHDCKASFRKYYSYEPKMKSLDVMTLMGQSTGLAASYNKQTVDYMLEEYLKAVDNLTIDKASTNEEMLRNQQALTTVMQVKDSQIPELKEQMYKMQQDFKSYDQSVKEVIEKVKYEREWHKREEEGRRILHDMLDKESPGWYERYLGSLGIGPNKPLSKEARKKIKEMREQMRNLPDDVYIPDDD